MLVHLSFSPDALPNAASKMLLVASPAQGLALWRVRRCGRQRTLLRETVADARVRDKMGQGFLAASWHGNAAVVFIDRKKELFKVCSNALYY